jgi:uncharacterized protein (DUF1330 family)
VLKKDATAIHVTMNIARSAEQQELQGAYPAEPHPIVIAFREAQSTTQITASPPSQLLAQTRGMPSAGPSWNQRLRAGA